MAEQYTLEEFGQRIKKKYPQYSKLSDADIANKVLAKYPQYKSAIKSAAPPSPTTPAAQPSLLKRAQADIDQTLSVPAQDAGWRGDVERIGQAVAQIPGGMIAHPLQAAKSIAETSIPPLAAYEALKQGREYGKEIVANPRQGLEHLGGNVIGMYLTGEVAGALPKAAGEFKGVGAKALEAARSSMKRGAGVNPLDIREEAQTAVKAKDLETKRGGLQKQIHDTSRELQGRIETARNNALKEGNAKYNAFNEQLNPLSADMETMQNAELDASEKLKGSDKVPPILKDLRGKIQKGESLDYEDLQGYYSELGKELTKGTLPGDEYTALNTLHESIGDEMQRIADAQGLGEQLTEARSYWRKMKQTFGKPAFVRDVATKTLRTISPEFAKEEETANRVRLLSDYDPEIQRAVDAVTEARKSLKALPKAKAAESEGLSPQTVKEKQQEQIRQTGRAFTHSKSANVIGHAMTGFGSTWAIVEALRGQLEYAGAVVAARVLVGLAQRGAGALLDSPGVSEWLARPTAKEVKVFRELTPEQKAVFGDSLKPLLEQAKVRGIKVSPSLAALVGTSAAALSRTRQLQELREKQRVPAQQ